ncbi:26S proteasome non-ATPase regulatory subunit 14 [Hordeum vulgare]|nr:26S proteasome non-ATPase regulatory subunit 14 [Hordeum vulgare]
MDNHMLAGLLAAAGLPEPSADAPLPDSSEQIYIAPVALLKMLKHARAGVPMEVMGLMLGEFVDEYTVTVVDLFAMPQSGTGVSVEANGGDGASPPTQEPPQQVRIRYNLLVVQSHTPKHFGLYLAMLIGIQKPPDMLSSYH